MHREIITKKVYSPFRVVDVRYTEEVNDLYVDFYV